MIVENDLWEEADRQGALLKRRKGRLRISPDGVEVNGHSLRLSGILFHIMQCFRLADRVEERTLALDAWGDELKDHEAIHSGTHT